MVPGKWVSQATHTCAARWMGSRPRLSRSVDGSEPQESSASTHSSRPWAQATISGVRPWPSSVRCGGGGVWGGQEEEAAALGDIVGPSRSENPATAWDAALGTSPDTCLWISCSFRRILMSPRLAARWKHVEPECEAEESCKKVTREKDPSRAASSSAEPSSTHRRISSGIWPGSLDLLLRDD